MKLHLLRVLLLAMSIQLSAGADDAADKALQDAQDFARKGEYAKALERHEWYHENALSIDPAQYGVRLSFALSYWKDLGEKYPPALASLKAIRDRDVKALEAGTAKAAVFHDVSSINRTLDETPATTTFFKKLDAEKPAVAKQCFRYIQADLLALGESELFTKYTGDFAAYLKQQIARQKEIETFYTQQKMMMAKETIANSKEELITTTLQLADMATKQGHADTAAQLKAITFKSIPDHRLAP